MTRKLTWDLGLAFSGVLALVLAVWPAVGRLGPTAGIAAAEEAMPADYWTVAVPFQGQAPAHWSDLEKSLAPESCADCHEDQYADWRTSLHAGSFSLGLVGQMLSMYRQSVANCMQCHAPLTEQRTDFMAALADGVGHVGERQGLAAAGVACAACHVRNHRRFGPPQRDTGAVGASDPDNPHGGVHRAAWFEKSEFCVVCHQFPQEYAVNGKPLENTYVEWQASPQAAQGITCQVCHMPERRHLWRGIHDPDMVAAGLTAHFSATAEEARFTLTNSGVGHAFPTYVTPRVEMHAVALDADGREVPATAVLHVIQRAVAHTGGRWVENFDSRLLPTESATLSLPWQGYAKARLWLEVKPDDYYDNYIYDVLLSDVVPGSPAERLLARADRAAHGSSYRLFDTEIDRP
ncbi:MAG: multiheme c-type cytochrome [Alphaproteobacteria bacterium]